MQTILQVVHAAASRASITALQKLEVDVESFKACYFCLSRLLLFLGLPCLSLFVHSKADLQECSPDCMHLSLAVWAGKVAKRGKAIREKFIARLDASQAVSEVMDSDAWAAATRSKSNMDLFIDAVQTIFADTQKGWSAAEALAALRRIIYIFLYMQFYIFYKSLDMYIIFILK